MENLIVIGGGQAACSCGFKLRQLGYEGNITILGDEGYLPYQRPPLSKQYLLNKIERERLFLKPQSAYEQANIAFHVNCEVQAIDRKAKKLTTNKGDFAYDKLVITTGSTPITFPKAIGDGLDEV